MARVKQRVLIVGAGFGGMEAARRLDPDLADIVLVDRHNHHLFQPLLYQVATAALSPSDIATANRTVLRGHKVRVMNAEATGVDAAGKRLLLSDGRSEPFDRLVLATGCAYSFFGHDEWAPHAFVLKSLADGLTFRNHILRQFEKAALTTDPAEIRRLLTVVIVGDGPTGVELSGTIAELARSMLAHEFYGVHEGAARIILCEAADRLLQAFTEQQSAYTADALRSLGVDVRLDAAVENIEAGCITIAGERIDTPTVLWCAGTAAQPAAAWVDAQAAKNGALCVEPDCSVPGHPDIFAIGDVACYRTPDGQALPGLAPVAKQQGRYVAGLINARLAGRADTEPFRYRDWGSLAIIGRSRAVANFGTMRFEGLFAWLSWALIHLALLTDFRSRILVYINWTWAWLTRNRGVRLIVDGARHPAAEGDTP